MNYFETENGKWTCEQMIVKNYIRNAKYFLKNELNRFTSSKDGYFNIRLEEFKVLDDLNCEWTIGIFLDKDNILKVCSYDNMMNGFNNYRISLELLNNILSELFEDVDNNKETDLVKKFEEHFNIELCRKSYEFGLTYIL